MDTNCTFALEVVGDPNHWIRKSGEPAIGVEDVARNVEVRRFDDDTAILGANVEARADLVGDTAPIQCADLCLSFGVKGRSAALDGRENITAYAALEKRV